MASSGLLLVVDLRQNGLVYWGRDQVSSSWFFTTQAQLPPVLPLTWDWCCEFIHSLGRNVWNSIMWLHEPGAWGTGNKSQTPSSNNKSVYCSGSFVFFFPPPKYEAGREDVSLIQAEKPECYWAMWCSCQHKSCSQTEMIRNATSQFYSSNTISSSQLAVTLSEIYSRGNVGKEAFYPMRCCWERKGPRSNNCVKCCLGALTSPEESQCTLMVWGLSEVL